MKKTDDELAKWSSASQEHGLPPSFFWIDQDLKSISFHQIPGFERVQASNPADPWEEILAYIENGYRVQ